MGAVAGGVVGGVVAARLGKQVPPFATVEAGRCIAPCNVSFHRRREGIVAVVLAACFDG